MAVVRPNQIDLDQTPIKINLRYRSGDSASFSVQVDEPTGPFDFTGWTLTGEFTRPEDEDAVIGVSGNDEGLLVTGISAITSDALGPGMHPYAVKGVHATYGTRTFVAGVLVGQRVPNV